MMNRPLRVRCVEPRRRVAGRGFGLTVCLLGLLAVVTSGCSVGATHWPSDEEMAAFQDAKPLDPLLELDAEALLPGLPNAGPYKVVSGDILAVTGAQVFSAVQPVGLAGASQQPMVIESRVREDGQVNLPLVGAIDAAGATLQEIEAKIIDELEPYVKQEPAIVVRVGEHAMRKVAVLGAVENPGVIELPSDQMTLVGALTEAGGILKATNLKVGAKIIRIRRPGEARRPGDEKDESLALPVRGLNIPFGDVALAGGETIEVERWDPDIFTVVGLVTKPGAYEYPPNRSYNLMEAIAIAGGTDRIADPPYATVFRKDPETGEVLAVTFGLSMDDLVKASMVEIRPGDVVSLQHTIGSWTRSLIAQVFRVQMNFFVDPLNNR